MSYCPNTMSNLKFFSHYLTSILYNRAIFNKHLLFSKLKNKALLQQSQLRSKKQLKLFKLLVLSVIKFFQLRQHISICSLALRGCILTPLSRLAALLRTELLSRVSTVVLEQLPRFKRDDPPKLLSKWCSPGKGH